MKREVTFRGKLGRMELGRKEIRKEWEMLEGRLKDAIRETENFSMGVEK